MKTNIAIEKKTIEAMIKLYCSRNHQSKALCHDCNELFEYAINRIDLCPLLPDKPNCNDCKIHCYKKDKREKIKEIMRYSGPKMILYHPILALRHIIRKK